MLRQPQRLHRTRRARSVTPAGAIYVGRPTLWGNPFSNRERIGHRRSIILYRAWLVGQVDAYVLECAGFSVAEVAGLRRWRDRLLNRIGMLRGRDLQCWCPLTSDWCHADTLLSFANGKTQAKFEGKND